MTANKKTQAKENNQASAKAPEATGADVQALEQQLQSLQQQAEDADKQLSELTDQISEKENALTELDKQVDEKQQQLALLESEINNKNKPSSRKPDAKKSAEMTSLKGEKSVRIRSKNKNGFRRAGIKFNQEFQTVDLTELSKEQLENLEREINLGDHSALIAESPSE